MGAVHAAVVVAVVLAPVHAAHGAGAENRHAPDAAGDAGRGRVLLERYQCGSCHEIPGVPAARGRAGPPLVHFGRRAYIAGHLPNRPDILVRWIVAPAALVPGTPMPAMGATAADARDMAAYLAALR